MGSQSCIGDPGQRRQVILRNVATLVTIIEQWFRVHKNILYI